MLAMVVNDNAGFLNACGALRFFASRLALQGLHCQSYPCSSRYCIAICSVAALSDGKRCGATSIIT
jgi:hypothetical protein